MIEPIINNYESIKDKLFVLDPDTGEFVRASEWIKSENPERAEVVAIDTPYYRIAFGKKFVGRATFEKAQELASGVYINGKQCRCPRRNESNYIYDARFYGLDELLQRVGGDKLEGRVWWTCEKDSWCASRYLAYFFWIFSGAGGYAYSSVVGGSYSVLPVVLLPVGGANSMLNASGVESSGETPGEIGAK